MATFTCPNPKKLESWSYNRCSTAAPGLYPNLIVTFKEWLNTIPAKDDYPTTGDPNSISSDITLDTVTYTDAVWSMWYTSPEKAGFEGELQGDIGSGNWKSTITAFAPGNSALMSYLLGQVTNKELFMLYRYNSAGKWRLLGDEDFPCFILPGTKEVTGLTGQDSIGYELSIGVPNHDHPFPYYTGTIPAITA